jgi:hypothetical protein
MNVSIIINESVLFGQITGEEDATSLGEVAGVGRQVGDGLAGKFH